MSEYIFIHFHLTLRLILTHVADHLSSFSWIPTVSPHGVAANIITNGDGEPAIVSPEDGDGGEEGAGEVEGAALAGVQSTRDRIRLYHWYQQE